MIFLNFVYGSEGVFGVIFLNLVFYFDVFLVDIWNFED